jgi:hypothetical protein
VLCVLTTLRNLSLLSEIKTEEKGRYSGNVLSSLQSAHIRGLLEIKSINGSVNNDLLSPCHPCISLPVGRERGKALWTPRKRGVDKTNLLLDRFLLASPEPEQVPP